jgi:hypothetical protein
MSDETIDLFIQNELEKKKRDDDAFWEAIEQEAAKYEVTCDYYLAEFV